MNILSQADKIFNRPLLLHSLFFLWREAVRILQNKKRIFMKKHKDAILVYRTKYLVISKTATISFPVSAVESFLLSHV